MIGTDSRVEEARDVAREIAQRSPHCAAEHVLPGLLAFADERLRINVGLAAENADLRRRLRETNPPEPEIGEVMSLNVTPGTRPQAVIIDGVTYVRESHDALAEFLASRKSHDAGLLAMLRDSRAAARESSDDDE